MLERQFELRRNCIEPSMMELVLLSRFVRVIHASQKPAKIASMAMARESNLNSNAAIELHLTFGENLTLTLYFIPRTNLIRWIAVS